MLVLNTPVLQEGWHPQDRRRKPVVLMLFHLATAEFLSLLTQPHRWSRIHSSLGHKIAHSKWHLLYFSQWAWTSQSTTRINKIRRKVGSKLCSPGPAKECHKRKYTVKTKPTQIPPAKPRSLHSSFPSSICRQQPLRWGGRAAIIHQGEVGTMSLVGHEPSGARPDEPS